jgi:hypothetical protein
MCSEKIIVMGTKKINFDTPESLVYENQQLRLTVLGGVKLDGLDRLRVTLKIELPKSTTPPVRHNLDLYNDTQLEKLVRKTAERLEIGTSVIAASIAELTEQLEAWRMEQIKNIQPEMPQRPVLSDEEHVAAECFLREPNLMERTNEQIGQSGILGEEVNRLIMYLIFTSRKRPHPLHVVSLGASGTGKTHLQEKVGELIPEEDKIEITTLSENAFYYFGQRELKHKLILIEDLDGAEDVLYPLRELQSKKKISKTVAHKNNKGETRSVHLVVEGPVSVAGCTTREQLYEDNANRSFLLYLDESKEQDARVMAYQRSLSAGRVDQQAQEKAAQLLRNCQRLLEPVRVVNPYAELLHIPVEVLKPRRTNNHYLQFIEAVTFYHQKQRTECADPASGEVYIETTIEDIEHANALLKHVLLHKSDQLTGACRTHFEKLKLFLIGEGSKQFHNQQISKLFRIPITTVKRYHLELTLGGYLKAQKLKGSKAYTYEIADYHEYQQLQDRVKTVLDEALTAVKEQLSEQSPVVSSAVLQGQKPISPKQPTAVSGPVKPAKTKRSVPAAHKPDKIKGTAQEITAT